MSQQEPRRWGSTAFCCGTRNHAIRDGHACDRQSRADDHDDPKREPAVRSSLAKCGEVLFWESVSY